MGEFVRYEQRGHVAYVTIDRPQVRNALHDAAHAELAGAWRTVAAADDVWVAVLSGAGDEAFCAGGDLSAALERAEAGAGMPQRDGGFGGLTERLDLFKPVIAAVHGWCVGGGFELALACDLIVASEDARFGLTEPRRGLVPTGGGVQRLVRHLPLKEAMALLLTGGTIDAQEARRQGIVNEVVPVGGHLEAAAEWAARVVACAPLAVRAIKEVALGSLDLPLEEALRHGQAVSDRVRWTEDRREGLDAFRERRSPQWRGR